MKTNLLQNKLVLMLISMILPVIVILVPIEGLDLMARKVLAVSLFILISLITNWLPMSMTGIIPCVLVPLLCISSDVGSAWVGFGQSVVWMALGIFLFAAALEKWNMHKRVGYVIAYFIGRNAGMIVLGVLAATGFCSAFMSNNVALAIMIPIGTAIATQMGTKEEDPLDKAIMLAMTFGATIGGMATTMGTGTNILSSMLISQYCEVDFGFLEYLKLGLPFALVLLPVAWIVIIKMCKIDFKTPIERSAIKKEMDALGPMKVAEWELAVIFVIMLVLYVKRSSIAGAWFPDLSDASVALIIGFLLFVVPVDPKKGEMLLDFKSAKERVDYSMLIMLAGIQWMGVAIGNTNIAEWIAGKMGFLSGMPEFAVVFIFAAVCAVITEFLNNGNVIMLMMPVAYSVAVAVGVRPMVIMFAVSISANLAYMLPSGTPVTALALSTGKLRPNDLVKVGFVLKLAAIVVMYVVFYAVTIPMSGL